MAERRLKFMVIGAQKAGTTWLHANLSKHPQVVFPPIKELFFFNEIDASIPTSLWGRKFNNHWLNIKWKKVAKYDLPLALRKGDFEIAKWYLRYLTIPRNLKPSTLARYDRLFPYRPDAISGDITPNYSVISSKTIDAIAEYYPNCKILFILRNPVDRSFSQAKMNLGKLMGRDINDVSRSEIEEYLVNNPSNEQLSDYRTTIGRWSARFPKERLYFNFYDALAEDPVSFYRDVLDFLELDWIFNEKTLRRVVYKGAAMESPRIFRRILSVKYLDQIKFLADYFKHYPINYPAQWLEQAQNELTEKTNTTE